MEKEERILRCIVGKVGGNSGGNAVNYKISIPNAWANEMGITKEDRELKVTFDGEKIIIERP